MAQQLFALVHILRSPPVTPPYASLLIGLFHLIAALLRLLEYVLTEQPVFEALITGVPALAFVLLAASLPLSPYPAPPRAPGVPGPAREDYATLLEWVTFSWLTPIINEGYERDLDDSDVFSLSATSRSALILRKMEALSGSLFQRLWIANAHDVFADMTLTFVSAALSVSGPFFLKRILEAITQAASSPTGKVSSSAYLLPLAAFTASVLKAQTDLQHLYHGRRACEWPGSSARLPLLIRPQASASAASSSALCTTRLCGRGRISRLARPRRPLPARPRSPRPAHATSAPSCR